jgi:hypothetical protein
MTAWLLLVVALLFLGLAPVGFWKALRSPLPRRRRVGLWVIALLIGGATVRMPGYSIDSRTQAFGFPLPYAFFQRDANGHWLDYVGPLTVPFFYANAVVNGGVVLLVGSLLLKRRRAGEDRQQDGTA